MSEFAGIGFRDLGSKLWGEAPRAETTKEKMSLRVCYAVAPAGLRFRFYEGLRV